ncbi:hypothetical protein BV25DRAFT_1987089 [Artomyces pyxidatus]|uniref:Uncharacterized protein n=1 Tax=Artomyces pyxidatus TaxID=48021 RepID=A0ACB8TIS6_9AGAM|nr:hypothetical protein BV25DRAFT_1987089 [Artomyces pyxidatus]
MLEEPTSDPPEVPLSSGAHVSPSQVSRDSSLSRLTSIAESAQLPQSDHSVPKASVYIELSNLVPSEKARYTELTERDIPLDDEHYRIYNPGKVVGEYREGSTLWYYALRDDIIHRFEAKRFTDLHPSLVADYARRKRKGLLSRFDPSGSNVHPKSRPKFVINMTKLEQRAKRNDGSSKSRALELDSDGGEEWDDDVPEGDDLSDEATPAPTRRSTRTAASLGDRRRRQTTQELPFSPKKIRLRSARSAAVDTDDGDEDSDESPGEYAKATRRSTRQRKTTRVNVADEDYEDTGSDEGSFEYKGGRSKSGQSNSKPKIVRGRASRPAYGHVRSIVDLDYDPLDDGDTAPLRAHRDTCERCSRKPTHTLLEEEAKRGKRGKGAKKKKNDEDDGDEGDDKLAALGGWVRCMKCPLTAHWRCLANSQRDEILKAIRDRDRETWLATQPQTAGQTIAQILATKSGPPKRAGLESYQTTEFICAMCLKGGICIGCLEVALEPDSRPQQTALVVDKPPVDEEKPSISVPVSSRAETLAASLSSSNQVTAPEVTPSRELLFRCQVCKRLAHYAHLPVPEDNDDDDDGGVVEPASLALYYQRENHWTCADCSSYVYRVEKILAWRSYPPNAAQPSLPPGEPVNPKIQLPREYLVKWQDRSYRRTQWVPHGWLATIHTVMLRHFLNNGPKVELLKQAVGEEATANAVAEGGIGKQNDESRGSSAKPGERSVDVSLLDASPDAERRIPPPWKTVDRVLDVLLWHPQKRKAKGKGKSKIFRVESDDDDAQREWDAAFNFGEQPSATYTETLDEWVARTQDDITTAHIGKVVWAFIKWDDLGYEEATWDSPPRLGEPGYPAFELAFQRLVESRLLTVRSKPIPELVHREINGFRKHSLKQGQQPKLGQGEKQQLLPFQIDGFNWLCDNWWNRQPSILADEMGLGKTVQIATFVGNIIKKFDAFPVLIVVPNSTITNWVREFAIWAPKLRVVPFYGEAKSREVVKRYELNHTTKVAGTTGSKFHVLVTTYDTITSKDLPVFKNVPRWEVLVVDEGQRLKSDTSLLFRKLNELKIMHRIIMTGTPLNNNIRELFNLMNFLDPNEWADLEQLEKDHEELTPDLVSELHNRLRPYFLRRVKAEVLTLPPKNEVIVPVSLTPLQKEVYKSILSKNVKILMNLTKSLAQSKTRVGTAKGSMNNILMELRKCIQHPYLVSDDIEPKGLGEREAHDKLVAASAKLRFLKTLLPKLKERGHRVLLFSQFVIALNVIEDFLVGEGVKYLRLDGNTKQVDRQKGMDEFNRPGSDVFIYLLTTRAGGVGINLWSADTVIIYDPDFNPHQDLQAIARSHRYGQTKPCLVFKLMAKDTAEERIIQTGKKKLVLDHVIVQKMDDEEGGTDVQSILTFGAKALFEEGGGRDIIYSDHDVDKLIEKTETEGDQDEKTDTSGLAFSFAKIWTADKDELEEMEDDPMEDLEPSDSWALELQRIAEELAKEQTQEATGRGVRRKAAMAVKPQQKIDLDDTPKKGKVKGKQRPKSKGSASDESEEYNDPISNISEDTESEGPGSVPDELVSELQRNGRLNGARAIDRSSSIPEAPVDAPTPCGLCGTSHSGPCYMTDSSENLAEYRKLLFFEATDEPIEDRRAAIEIIDDTLNKRGQLHLIHGQPLRLIEPIAIRSSPQRPYRNPNVDASPLAMHSTASQTRVDDMSLAGPSATPNDRPKPSKRPSLPFTDDQSRKKARTNSSRCVVCGKAPHHLLKDCPVVAGGSASITNAIAELNGKAEHRDVVSILQKLLSKHQRRESMVVPMDTT